MSVLYFAALNEKESLNNQYDILRKTYQALSCKCNGIGPTGGFCLDRDKIHVGGNQAWCKNLAKELRRLFDKQSVYDFGAGLGWYGKALLANETDGYRMTSYKAFDGAENLDIIFPDRFVTHLDLSQPAYMEAKDWVLSLEVGEHIPVAYEKIFIDNLHRHNKKGIVLSWAVEGNCIDQIYSID
ncbi:unnamed protein product [Adineta steineri]|uniref:Class I SAM-dependent methyltransferase n=1 Tax=Adineta steineri TaxID=433720 RepID=A0A814C2L0_9BILA|nr:unnamed protein product [Adineta steineri]CAF0934427.1 unnamed protein product [Adineta steineri]